MWIMLRNSDFILISSWVLRGVWYSFVFYIDHPGSGVGMDFRSKTRERALGGWLHWLGMITPTKRLGFSPVRAHLRVADSSPGWACTGDTFRCFPLSPMCWSGSQWRRGVRMTPSLPGLLCGIQWLVLDELSWRNRGTRKFRTEGKMIHLMWPVLALNAM